MRRTFRCGAAAAALAWPACLAGCSTQHAAISPAPTGAAAARFTLDTPLDRIAADQRGKAILLRDVPGLMASRSYFLFDDMSLDQIASVSSGRLTKSKLDQVQTDLAELDASGR